MLVFEFFYLSFIFWNKFVVIFFWVQFLLHSINDFFKRVKFSLEERVYIFALFGGPWLFQEIGEVLIEMDGATFTEPVRKFVVMAEKDHQLHFLFRRPILMFKDWFPMRLFLSIHIVVRLSVLLRFSIAFGAGSPPECFFHLVWHLLSFN